MGTTVLHDYRDGVFFVNLAPLADPALVPSAIAEVLGVKEAADRTLLDSLVQYLKEKHLVLVLDNYEHLLEAAAMAAHLLEHCRELHILVTSRIPLHLNREHEYAVPPLSVPDLQHLPTLASLSQYESVALFINRARAVKSDFEVTNDTAPAVAVICHRLDGLPLAIELAAARIKLFPPRALLHRLDHRLKLLTGGAKDRPTRQQTLRNTIDWSYSLLSPEEQAIFARLSIFAGGCVLEAAEAVCGPEEEIEIMDGVTSLLEQNLLREMAEEEPRFTMLETIREYAQERLESGDEAEAVRERHAAYYLRLAEDAEPELTGAEQAPWLNRLEAEHDNLRAALGWMLAEQRAEDGLRLAVRMERFWQIRGHISEGRQWLDRALAVGGEAPPAARAKALHGAGFLAWIQGDHERATALDNQSVALQRELGDTLGIATSLNNLGNVVFGKGNYERATILYDQSVVLGRELGDTHRIAASLSNLGAVAFALGEHERAAALHDQSLVLFRELGDTWGITHELNSLGEVACAQEDYDRATFLSEESLTLRRELGDTAGIASSLHNLGTVAFAQRDYVRAITLYRESLFLAHELGDNHLNVGTVESLGNVATVRHEPERAARLWGATDAWREAHSVPRWPVDRQLHARMAAKAQQQLDVVTWTAAWDEGRAMSLERAIQYALREHSAGVGQQVP